MSHLFRNILILLIGTIISSWGFFAHKKINETAVFLLPKEIAGFYKYHIKTITQTAINADKRCYADTLEPPKHYIDLDEYEDSDSIPIHWSKAKEKYTERKLLATGIIPWQIQKTYTNLVNAFANKDYPSIIRYSADIGHYIGDAHVPLHTTSNYNGQYTNQIGIHALWESRIPEMFHQSYDYMIGPAIYIADPLEYIWKIVKESNSLVDSVLIIEANLRKSFKTTDVKSYLERNNQLTLNYSDKYASAYHKALNGMIEKRLRSSIHTVASFWYSAWIDAGQPKLIHKKLNIDNINDSTNLPIHIQKLGREELAN